VHGRFFDFCERARKRDGLSVLIIDEINRANLARVFGELMYLLEYRQGDTDGIPLAGGGGRFHIPTNVRLIGTMNTADRSIALVDHALRRRFAFLRLVPDYDVLRRFHEREKTDFPIEGLIKQLEHLNGAINDPHYSLGISFFMRKNLAKELPDIWAMFELFVAEWLKQHLPERFELLVQHPVSVGERDQLTYKIDLVLRDRRTGKALCVLDTKYKSTDSPASEDVNQVVTCAELQDSKKAVLLYPSPLATTSTLKVGRFNVRCFAFDLKGDLEHAGKLLLEQILAFSLLTPDAKLPT